MRSVVTLVFSIIASLTTHTANSQSTYLRIKYQPDSCLQSNITFSIQTNLMIEKIIEWNFGDWGSGAANTATNGSPAHTFSNAGSFVVSCILQVNCSGPIDPGNPISFPCFYLDTIYAKLTIFDCDSADNCAVFLPNTFTPNKDGINESFGAFHTCDFEKYELLIFNRWGQMVFSSSNPAAMWNGDYKGIECPDGVYVYVISYKLFSQSVLRKIGNVLVIR